MDTNQNANPGNQNNNQAGPDLKKLNQTPPTPATPAKPAGQEPNQVPAQNLPKTPQQATPENMNQPKPAASAPNTTTKPDVQANMPQQNNESTGKKDQSAQVSSDQSVKPQVTQSPTNESQGQPKTEQTAVQTMSKDDVELEKSILDDIRIWLGDMIEVTKGRQEGGLDKLLDKMDLLENFSQKINADDTKKALTKSEKEEFVNIYNEVCKDIEHNFVEVQDVSEINGSYQSLSLIIFLMDFGFEYLCIILGQLYTGEELLSRLYIRDHYFAAQQLLDERRAVIGAMIDPFTQFQEDETV